MRKYKLVIEECNKEVTTVDLTQSNYKEIVSEINKSFIENERIIKTRKIENAIAFTEKVLLTLVGNDIKQNDITEADVEESVKFVLKRNMFYNLDEVTTNLNIDLHEYLVLIKRLYYTYGNHKGFIQILSANSDVVNTKHYKMITEFTEFVQMVANQKYIG